MQKHNPYQILKMEFPGIRNTISSYTGDELILNYLRIVQEALDSDSYDNVLYGVDKLCRWYNANIDAIMSNEFEYNKDAQKNAKTLLEELYSQLERDDFSEKESDMLSYEKTLMSVKEPKIFISHSSKDKNYVELFVKLLREMGLSAENIFCSSLPSYDIPMDGTTILDCIRDQFSNYNLHVIFVHSKNYYQSPVSLNEMGAAWILNCNHSSILLPGFPFEDMKGVIRNDEIALKLDSNETEVKDKLNQLYKKIANEFHLEQEQSVLWEQNRDGFIKSVKEETSKSSLSKAKVVKRPF